MAPGRRRDRSSVNPCLKYFIFLFNFVFLVSRPREIIVVVLTVRVFCSVRITLVFSEFNKLLYCNDRHCDCESSSTLYSQTGVVIHGPSSKSSRFVSMLFYLSGFENRFTHHVYDKERYIDVHSNLVSSLFYNYPSIKFQYCNERERGRGMHEWLCCIQNGGNCVNVSKNHALITNVINRYFYPHVDCYYS